MPQRHSTRRAPGGAGALTIILGVMIGRRTRLALLAALATGCTDPTGSGTTDAFPEVPETYGHTWLGIWEGTATGSVGGAEYWSAAARLTVSPDADSVRIDSCPECVTVTLDTLFALANVLLLDPVEISVTYADETFERTLRLDRFSGGGGTANVAHGPLTLEAAVQHASGGEILYHLVRR